MITRTVLRLAAVACVTVLSCWGQQPEPQKISVETLIDQMRSDDAGKRSEAYQQLRSNPQALRGTKVRAALLELLERESREFDSRVRAAQRPGQNSEGADSDDGNPEYMDDLVSTVESFADLHDPNQICILVKTGYMPASTLASENALRVKAAMPCIVHMSESNFILDRERADRILVRLLAQVKDALDPGTVQAIRQIVVRALQDTNEAVRSTTVDALGDFGGQDMIPALRQVEESDPAVSKTRQNFWIREDAAKAIAAIQKESRPTLK